MLAVFFQIMPVDKPTYYGESSTMAMANKKLNPGLGFRPQIDVEDHQIVFDPTVQMDPSFGLQKYKRNLEVYFAASMFFFLKISIYHIIYYDKHLIITFKNILKQII